MAKPTRHHLNALFLLVLLGAATAADAQVDQQRAQTFFKEAQTTPSLIVHGDADPVVPIVEGETMYAALSKAGVPASFIRVEGAGHRFDGADFTRANAEMVRWFEQHLRNAAK